MYGIEIHLVINVLYRITLVTTSVPDSDDDELSLNGM